MIRRCTDRETGWREFIERDPATVHGQPRVRERPVTAVLDCLAAGMSGEEVLGQYPTLNHDAIRPCVGFAADVVHDSYGPSVPPR